MFDRSIATLVRRFEDTTLPRAEWTHAAHLLVALDYARRFAPADAVMRLRAGIKRYNGATGTTEMARCGYHETITLAWFHLVRHFLDLFDDGRTLADLADALIALFGRDELFRYYSRRRLLSAEARAGWVEPDVRPLPELEPFTPRDRAWLQSLDARLSQGASSSAERAASGSSIPTNAMVPAS